MLLSKEAKRVLKKFHNLIDIIYLNFDKRLIKRTKNLRLLPDYINRRGGKVSYLEWGHVIGIFQTILFMHLNNKSNNIILDVGCGTGLCAIACEPFILDEGKYIGIDVSKKDIEFCKNHYKGKNFLFKHHDVLNQIYAPNQSAQKKRWDIADKSVDMVTALSVWTHLNEDDAIYYFHEIERVLKPKGKAIMTFFLLDDIYLETVKNKTNALGKFHNTVQSKWVFDKPCSNSHNWFTTKWAKNPEDAIAVTTTGLNDMLNNTGLSLIKIYTGNWKGIPGIYFQDILIFEKASY